MTKQTLTVTMPVLAGAVMAVLGFVFGLAPAVHAQGTSAVRSTTLARTTLVVGDIDKSLDFYQRVGLFKTSDTSTTDSGQGSVFGAADLPLTADSKISRLVILKGGDAALLALVWYDQPQLPSARGNLVGIGSGDVIVSIEVPDIQGAYGKLSQIGTRFQRTPVRFTQTNADGTGQTGQHFLAYDPDGHMVEVTQMDRR
jgi:catechol 2,3-dioxygenase-like lactoylglutathione lyase family enzyme